MFRSRRFLPSTSALVAFEAVERLCSFSAAAEELSLTQSAVSRQVKALEEQLGCVLLERTSKSVRSTAIGANYAVGIRKSLSLLRNATVNAISGIPNAEIRLAILPTFGTRWLMPRIPSFIKQRPDVTLSFSNNIHPFAFADSEIDAAIYHGKSDWPGTEATLLLEEYMVPVAAPALVKEIALNDASSIFEQLRLQLESRPLDWQNWFSVQGVDTRAPEGMKFEHFSTLIQACVGGVGIALLPEVVISTELEQGSLIAIGERVLNNESYYFIQPRLEIRHAAVDALRDWLLKEVESATT